MTAFVYAEQTLCKYFQRDIVKIILKITYFYVSHFPTLAPPAKRVRQKIKFIDLLAGSWSLGLENPSIFG